MKVNATLVEAHYDPKMALFAGFHRTSCNRFPISHCRQNGAAAKLAGPLSGRLRQHPTTKLRPWNVWCMFPPL